MRDEHLTFFFSSKQSFFLLFLQLNNSFIQFFRCNFSVWIIKRFPDRGNLQSFTRHHRLSFFPDKPTNKLPPGYFYNTMAFWSAPDLFYITCQRNHFFFLSTPEFFLANLLPLRGSITWTKFWRLNFWFLSTLRLYLFYFIGSWAGAQTILFKGLLFFWNLFHDFSYDFF